MSFGIRIATGWCLAYLCVACSEHENPSASSTSSLLAVILANVPDDIGGDAQLLVQTQSGASLAATVPAMAGARLETEGNGVLGVTVFLPSARTVSPGAGYYAVFPAGLTPTGTLAVNAWSFRDGVTPIGTAGAINSLDAPPPNAAIGGIVTDPATSLPVSGAIVWTGLSPDQISAATLTDAQGAYQLLVRPGVYDVTVSTPASNLTQAVDATTGSVQHNASVQPGVPAATYNVLGTVVSSPDGLEAKPLAGATITFGGQTTTTSTTGEFAIQAPMGLHVLQASAPDHRSRGHLFMVGQSGFGRVTVTMHSLCPSLYGTWYLSAAEWIVSGGFKQGSYPVEATPELWTWGADGQYTSELDNWGTPELDRSPGSRGGWHCVTRPDGTLSWSPLEYEYGWMPSGVSAAGMSVYRFTPSPAGTIEGSQFFYRYKRYAKQGGQVAGTCPSLACGGNPEGSWRAQSTVCAEGDLDAMFFDGTMLATCDGAVESANLPVDESFVFSGGTIAVTEGPTVEVVRLKLNSACFRSLFETSLDASTCAAAGPRLAESAGDNNTATCQMNGADCSCTLTTNTSSGLTEQGTYSLSGNTMSYQAEASDGTGSTESMQFCVDGNKLYMGVAKAGSPLVAVVTYVRQ